MEPKQAIANLYLSKYYRVKKRKKKTLKNCQEQPHLLSGHFIKMFYRTTTCPRQPPLRGPKSGCLI